VRYAVLALIASQVVLFVAAIFLGGAHVHVPRGAGGLITEGAFLVVLIPLWRSGRLHPVDLGLRRAPAAASVGLAVLSLIAVSFLQSWWIRAANVPRAHSAIVSVSHRTIVVIVLAGITACVAAPVIEEVFFRGFLYRSLRNRLPILPAALIVGVIFGLAHTQYPLLERPNQMIFGVAMCLLYERTGSLLPGIAVHSFIDASAFETALSGNNLVVAAVFLVLIIALLIGPTFRALRRTFSGGGRVATE
jgi:membrane protease YdiL (CAAX protease family)